METRSFDVPLGDELLAEDEASLAFTADITAWFAGGPTQVVRGRLYLSRSVLAFRCPVAMPHPQQVTVALSNVKGATLVRDRWLGVLPLRSRSLVVAAEISERLFHLRFGVTAPEVWAERIARTCADAEPPRSPDAVLEAALREGIRDRGRYVPTLAKLSFPQAYWHTEEIEALEEIVRNGMRAVGASAYLDQAFYAKLDLTVDTRTGPEDYETGEGSEMAERREQIARVMRAANAVLTVHAPKRFGSRSFVTAEISRS
ncbi:MAG: hypothetical protein JW751_11375 [Polyangiaceae bacterium]|nr:hypothetical protein [Polyangiaceae bacterium]